MAWLRQLSGMRDGYTHRDGLASRERPASEQLASQVVGGPGHSLSQRIQFLLAHHAVGANEEALGRRLFHRIRAWLRSRSTIAQSSAPGSRPRLAPLIGALAAVTLAARIKRTRLYPVINLILLAVACLAFILPYTSARLPVPEALKQRVAFDAIAILLCTLLGYRLLQSFLSHEGLASIRMQTELSCPGDSGYPSSNRFFSELKF